jgi:hypothetical protein
MTSITSSLQSALLNAIQSGGIKVADSAPIKSAITDIAGALTGPTAISASSMKTRVHGLIDQETTNGTLTDNQASELKGLYDKAADSEGGLGGFLTQLSSSTGAGGLYGAKGSPMRAIGSLLVHALV